MKTKNIFTITLMVIAACVVAVVSCTKEKTENLKQEAIKNNESSFSNINGIHVRVEHDTTMSKEARIDWLNFETKSDYELAISTYSNLPEDSLVAFENQLSFNSMRSSLTELQREDVEIEDDLLATLLSPCGTIQIGDYYFVLNVSKDTVLMYDLSSAIETVRVFSTDDEIFDILENKGESGDKGCSAKNKVKGSDVGCNSINAKVVYQKAGIYFSLQSKIKKDCYGGTLELFLSCGGNTNTYTRNRDNTIYAIPAYGVYGGDHSYHYRPYSGIRKLVNFHFSVSFLARDSFSNIDTGWFDLSIHCGV